MLVLYIRTKRRESRRIGASYGHRSLSHTPWQSAVSGRRKYRAIMDVSPPRLVYVAIDGRRSTEKPRNPVIPSVQALTRSTFAPRAVLGLLLDPVYPAFGTSSISLGLQLLVLLPCRYTDGLHRAVGTQDTWRRTSLVAPQDPRLRAEQLDSFGVATFSRDDGAYAWILTKARRGVSPVASDECRLLLLHRYQLCALTGCAAFPYGF